MDVDLREEERRLQKLNSPAAKIRLGRLRERAGQSCRVAAMDPDTGGSGGGSAIVVASTKRVLAVGCGVMPANMTGLRATTQQRRVLGPLLRSVGTLGRLDRFVVEIPIDYNEKRIADPNDLLRLSLISGAAAGIMDEFSDMVEWVEPYKWKGQRAKAPDWRNSLRYFGWPFDARSGGNQLPTFEVPEEVIRLSELPKACYPEIADALGIAIYALRQEGAC